MPTKPFNKIIVAESAEIKKSLFPLRERVRFRGISCRIIAASAATVIWNRRVKSHSGVYNQLLWCFE
jgi:hypothetical protein